MPRLWTAPGRVVLSRVRDGVPGTGRPALTAAGRHGAGVLAAGTPPARREARATSRRALRGWSERGVHAGVELRQERGAGGMPVEQLPGDGGGHRQVHGKEVADPPEVIPNIIGIDRGGGQVEFTTDRL